MSHTLELVPVWRGKNTCAVTLKQGESVLHADVIDPTKADHRAKFRTDVKEKAPALDHEHLEKEILKLADPQARADDQANMDRDEIDVRRVVRPELFFTPAVCGLTVPIAIQTANGLAGVWRTYLRWSDGRREVADLTDSFALANGERLRVHPIPAAPDPGMVGAWSVESRRNWLRGESASQPVAVFQAICQCVAFYLHFKKENQVGATALLALWIMLSYAYPVFPAVPYLHFGGPWGSGKSRALALLLELVFRALSSSNMTAACLFRTLHDRGGVFLYDEAERLRQGTPDQEDLRGIFLAGYKRSGRATRLEKTGDDFRLVNFDVFGPKALACINALPATLASRCIPVPMERADHDSPKPARQLEGEAQLATIRNDLHALALNHGQDWLDLPQRAVCPVGINNRHRELWQPLLALASWLEDQGAKGLLCLTQNYAKQALEESKDDASPEADELLLEAMAEKVRAGMSPTPSEILAMAKDMDSAIFDKWGPQGVSNRLRNYGLRTQKYNRRREYRVSREMLVNVQARYGIDLGFTSDLPKTLSQVSQTAS